MADETTYINNGIAESSPVASGDESTGVEPASNGAGGLSSAGSAGAATAEAAEAMRPLAQMHGLDDTEVQEWLESLDSVLETSGPEVATEILERLRAHAKVSGINLPFTANTPYANT